MAKRRDYGEGSIYQDSTKSWFVAIPIGDGKRKVVRAKDYTDAKLKLKQLQRDKEAGRDLSAKSQTTQIFLTHWVQEIAAPNVKPKTALFYQQMCSYYLIPAIGTLPLDKVQPQHIVKLMNDLRDRLSASTIRHAYVTGRIAFNVALRWGRITRNPFDMVDAPRIPAIEMAYLTLDQARRFLDAVDGRDYALLFHLALVLGLRRGELLAVQWGDIDKKQATISIARQLLDIDGEVSIDKPKTEAGIRTLPLPATLLAALLARRGMAGDNDLIFPSEAGTPIQPRNIARRYKEALKRAGLPAMRFHDTRHSCASMLAEIGTSESVIGAILGHSSHSGTVTRRYTHASMPAMRAAVESLYTLLVEKDAVLE